ncbi:hypothetical protein [Rhodovibrio salinarum]|uniref:Uncharacterized protein n=1 Tax=Rhodovibrio salinarum TaxID=1087 RepID=A0A934QMT7_9PROT|nr:hypothetical protein [Rhodovibrio salinarum]MBK1699334.1 hypothetical protein [Rhodovibrio salinarum]
MGAIVLGVCAFALAGFVAGRGLANVMDIGGEGLRHVYICVGTAVVCAIIGILVMTAVWV